MIANFNPAKPTDITGQATDFVRHLIVSGALAEGAKLPSTAALSEDWGVPVASVHVALSELVRDGLLVRQAGKGTFVCRDKAPLTAVAVYTLASALSNPESGIQRVILAELQRQLNEEGIQAHVVVDPREGAALGEPLEPLCRLSREHRVGATIACSAQHHHGAWLGRLPHSTSFGCYEKAAAQVAIDFNQMADLCLGALAEQGCRSMGMICALHPGRGSGAAGHHHPQESFYEHVVYLAGTQGLRLSDRWMKLAPIDIHPGIFARTGYDLFRELWAERDHPDGLFVYPDSFVPGVLLAMAELGGRPPALRLAYHRNEQTPLLNPYPATEAVLSEREIARALIAQAKRAWKGKTCGTIRVKCRRQDKV